MLLNDLQFSEPDTEAVFVDRSTKYHNGPFCNSVLNSKS